MTGQVRPQGGVGQARVPRCTLCPAFSSGRCQLEKREVMTDLRKAPPVWCPLREGDVTITLDEK